MSDKDKAAYWEGYNDHKACNGLASDPLTEFFFPSYDLPSGHKEAYDAGWSRAKNED